MGSAAALGCGSTRLAANTNAARFPIYGNATPLDANDEGVVGGTRGRVRSPKSKLEHFVKFKPQTPLHEIIRLTAE